MSTAASSRFLILLGSAALLYADPVCLAAPSPGEVAVVVNRSTRALEISHGAVGTVAEASVPTNGRLSDVAVSKDGKRLIATTGEGLVIFDAASLDVVRTITIPNALPAYRLALSPDGNTAAISHSNGQVSFVDLVNGQLIGRSPPWEPSFEGIEGIAFSVDGRFLYATASAPSIGGSLDATGFVLVIDTKTLQFAKAIETGRVAHHIVVTTDGGRGYVAGGYSVTEIDLVHGAAVGFVFIDSPASDLALSPDETTLYVTGYDAPVPISPSLVAVDAESLAVTNRLQLAGCGDARRVVVTSDGRFAFVVAENLSGVIAVDLERFQVTRFSETRGEPLGVAVAPEPASLADEIRTLKAAPPDPGDPWDCGVSIGIGSAVVTGGEATIDITLRGRRPVAGISQDILFDSAFVDLAPTGTCTLNPDIGVQGGDCFDANPLSPCKSMSYRVTPCPGGLCPEGPSGHTALRALILSTVTLAAVENAIPPGVVYRCRFTIADDADLGEGVPLLCSEALATDKAGNLIPVACSDGIILPSSAPAPQCPGDCDRDGEVTVDEIIVLSGISLGSVPASECRTGDMNLDGRVTVDETLSAVSASLVGCAFNP